ncbi:MAG: type II toxin-antitoxin system RelE/ParE family toxin, partial [Bradymonadaceae bacterium]
AGLGDDLVDEVERSLETLRHSPRIGTPLTGETRRFSLRRFPFHLVYTIDADVLVIVALAHQRRKPGYWKDRT